MYIGKVAERTGATPKAIRLYEQMGLIPVPPRKGRYRIYDDGFVEMITIIRTAQQLGFKLSEMKSLLDEEVSCSRFPWEKAARMVNTKKDHVEKQIKNLKKQKQMLEKFITTLNAQACTD